MSDIDRDRAGRLMGQAGLDALVITAPEGFRTVTGAPAGVPALFRRAGAALALLPGDPGARIGAVVTDLAAGAFAGLDVELRIHPMWAETARLGPNDRDIAAIAARLGADGRPPNRPRPTTYDQRAAYAHLGDLLAERGLARGRVGLDLDFWPAADFAVLRDSLPGVDFVDGSGVFDAIRAVKSPREIACLRLAGELAEAGVRAALAVARPGIDRETLAKAWHDGVEAERARRGAAPPTGAWEYIAVGPSAWLANETLREGAVLKFDVGTLVDGYSSDSGRTFALGRPADRARAIFDALAAGFEAGLERLKPGAALRDVHEAATAAIRKAGLTGFSRGHFGHGLGAGVFCEMAPFIAADSEALAEPGMVLAFETPFYAEGEGAFIIEDQFLITDTGAEPVWSLSRELVSL